MGVEAFLGSEPGLTLAGALASAVWTWVKSSAWFQRRREQRMARALDSLEAAVEETYRHYVGSLKAAREDGKLTHDEKQRARNLARERAIAIARTEGVDLMRELGGDYVDLWIARLVRKLKGA